MSESLYLRLPSGAPTAPGERLVERLIVADEGRVFRTCAYIRTPPGQGSRAGLHRHDFEQLYYVLDGTLTLEIEGETLEAPAGSLLVIPAGVEHRNSNRTDRDVVQLMIESRP
jgi:quercetin dioxygenase-like cupin family protein